MPISAADLRQRWTADEARAQPAEVAFVRRRESPVERVGDHQVQHRIAEELEALVVAVLGAAVRERRLEQFRIAAGARQQAREPRLERPGWRLHHRSCARPGWPTSLDHGALVELDQQRDVAEQRHHVLVVRPQHPVLPFADDRDRIRPADK